MKKIVLKTKINANYKKVFEKFDRDLFINLKPPGTDLLIERFDGCEKGDEIHLVLFPGKKLEMKWVSLITENGSKEGYEYFVDIGKELPAPLTFWLHEHRVEDIDGENCTIVDDIQFACSNPLIEMACYGPLYAQFALRNPMYKFYFKDL